MRMPFLLLRERVLTEVFIEIRNVCSRHYQTIARVRSVDPTPFIVHSAKAEPAPRRILTEVQRPAWEDATIKKEDGSYSYYGYEDFRVANLYQAGSPVILPSVTPFYGGSFLSANTSQDQIVFLLCTILLLRQFFL